MNCKLTNMLYPLRFQPILVERIWGGTTLARYGKPLPPGKPIGETWEISDRDKEQSVVINGPLKGQTLRQVMEKWGDELLGRKGSGTGVSPVDLTSANGRDACSTRFPLLIKMLDARERLSLQVHPPAAIAPQLGGEPKTEMWYILEAAPDAHLIAGLKRGTTRAQFEKNAASCVHRFPVHAGDSIFIPSGRVHAIDAGLVIVEIQQNSDTTYRVDDWGRGRQVHLAESMASIDFNDFEPGVNPLPIQCEHFRVEKLNAPATGTCDGTSFHILAGLTGTVTVNDEKLNPGDFVLLPAALGNYTLTGNGTVLRATL
ncbi:MAG: Mannose-6-phosphate isomerase ManA [Verrucomicrobiae bacterium]|nr:Mannose-6-phosphate isomerase ManA [Verrucomicrobiae bacterium]